jgi:integrase
MPIFLNAEEIHQLLELAKRGSSRYYALFQLMASTGLRESDALAIRRKDILAHDETVVSSPRLRMKKTGKIVERVLTTGKQTRTIHKAEIPALLGEIETLKARLWVGLTEWDQMDSARTGSEHKQTLPRPTKPHLLDQIPGPEGDINPEGEINPEGTLIMMRAPKTTSLGLAKLCLTLRQSSNRQRQLSSA